MDDSPHLQEAIAELRAADRLTGPSDETCAAVMAAWAEKHEAGAVVPMSVPHTTVVPPGARRRVLIASGVAACLVAAVGTGWWVSRLPRSTGEVANDSVAHASPAQAPAGVRQASPVAPPSPTTDGQPSLAALVTPEASASATGHTAPESPTPTPSGRAPRAARRRASAVSARAGSDLVAAPPRGSADGVDAAFVELAPTTAEDWAAARVLRVRVPEHAIRRLLLEPPGFTSGGMVQADLVLGEDGFARAIRLVREPTR